MSMLENIRRGKENRPPRLFIYGQEGVGKSTIGAAAPNPIFVQTEDGEVVTFTRLGGFLKSYRRVRKKAA